MTQIFIINCWLEREKSRKLIIQPLYARPPPPNMTPREVQGSEGGSYKNGGYHYTEKNVALNLNLIRKHDFRRSLQALGAFFAQSDQFFALESFKNPTSSFPLLEF